jgi:hypothetical protein
VNQMFNSREYALNDLMQALLDGVITDDLFIEAKQKVQAIKSEKERQRQKTAEEQRLKEIENNKPENAIPRLSRYEHVPENAREYREYIDTCDLALLEVFRDEMVNGKYKAEFRDEAHFQRVLTFLTLKINQRKAGEDPIQERNRLLREAKVEREALKKQTDEITRKLKTTANDLEQAKNTVKNAVKTDLSDNAKAYTA